MMRAAKRRVGAPPEPGTAKIGLEKQLREETRAFCVKWHRWFWGEDQFQGLDYATERAQWVQTRDLENKARPVLHRAKRSLEEVLTFLDHYEPGTGGLYSEGLLAMKPSILRALQRFDGASASRMIVEPSRTHWLRDKVFRQFSDGRRPHEIPVFELAVYSILGGWWPNSVRVRAPRLDIRKGQSVATVLSEEQKNIRAALKQLEKLNRYGAALAERLRREH